MDVDNNHNNHGDDDDGGDDDDDDDHDDGGDDRYFYELGITWGLLYKHHLQNDSVGTPTLPWEMCHQCPEQSMVCFLKLWHRRVMLMLNKNRFEDACLIV